jgi:hypothetical protein
MCQKQVAISGELFGPREQRAHSWAIFLGLGDPAIHALACGHTGYYSGRWEQHVCGCGTRGDASAAIHFPSPRTRTQLG